MKRCIREGNTAAFILFVAALLLCNWPLLSIAVESGGARILLYLFFIWFLIILCLGLYSRDQGKALPQTPDQEERP